MTGVRFAHSNHCWNPCCSWLLLHFFSDKTFKVNTATNIIIILHRWTPKAQLPPERICISNIAPVDVSGTYNLFYCLESINQQNSQFFYETQAMVLWDYRNNRTVWVLASATLIMVYGGWNIVWELITVHWFVKAGIRVLNRKCFSHRRTWQILTSRTMSNFLLVKSYWC